MHSGVPSRPFIRFLPFLIVCCVTTASFGETTELSRAKAAYRSGRFDKCLRHLSAASQENATGEDEVLAHLYSGLCATHLGQRRAAARFFEQALVLDPTAHLPVEDKKARPLFAEVASKLPQAMLVAPEEVVEAPRAPTTPPKPETVEQPSPRQLLPKTPSAAAESITRPVATTSLRRSEPGPSNLVPILAASASALAAGGGTFFALQAQQHSVQARSASFQSDAVALHQRASNEAKIANVCFGTAAGFAATALVSYLWLNVFNHH